jgi:hypothetical protein
MKTLRRRRAFFALVTGGIACLLGLGALGRAPTNAPLEPPRSNAVHIANPPLATTQASAEEAREPEPEAGVAREIRPHPITPAHERLRRERALVAELNRAMDGRNATALREGLETYRLEFPEDEQRIQEGYGVITDCLAAGSATRQAAERFYAANRGSPLRRWIRRICLEDQQLR